MLYSKIVPWRTRRCRTFLSLLAALALVSPEAVAATIEAIDPPTISTSISGTLPTYTWTVVKGTTAIASSRIQGAGTGETIGLDDIPQPTGWTFTANAQAGTYEWQTSANVTGTFVFSIMFAAPSDSEPAGSVEYDVLTGTTRTFTSFTPYTAYAQKAWAFNSVINTKMRTGSAIIFVTFPIFAKYDLISRLGGRATISRRLSRRSPSAIFSPTPPGLWRGKAEVIIAPIPNEWK